MSRICDRCGKGIQFGNRVSHAHNVNKRIWKPNLQRVRVIVDGKPKRIRLCTDCIKSPDIQKNVRVQATPQEKSGVSTP
ncbi:MAG: 50S ribosomal protein L28 [Candidatus Eisenbacteria bacterium]|uniref:Large ribosomal subunit protein bL28 n=1 Tax=Eiseniibacteriota bacterium TaxID=2212470 RepID=A0A948RXP9_UNCEI|nr:50S ribosomal protein L28 [Candidatus Eisenbacteria bacterium]MBU1949330.1 50S ribosomal protein L28 [Candidatus Eisenbacteria bacterium]MBU2692958.1 50S ribosomal protein L28 [Candidatus Eisenbacteria bacterium]